MRIETVEYFDPETGKLQLERSESSVRIETFQKIVLNTVEHGVRTIGILSED